MKIIFKIALAELRYLFYSPIAWLVIFLFYITGALIGTEALVRFTNLQEVVLEYQKDWIGFEDGVGAFISSMVSGKLFDYLFLFIPLLTMSVINREVNNGTIRLLYSSPVTSREIVLGKFLGVLIFHTIILLTFALIYFSVYVNIDHANYKWALVTLLGFFLIMNAYAAIGMFLSSITNYQVVAAMFTFVLLYFLGTILQYGQDYSLLRDITWAMSMHGKGEVMIGGLLTSRDIVYFLIIIALFVGYTIIKVDSALNSGKKLKSYLKAAALTIVLCVIGSLTSEPGNILYYDATAVKSNTIHANTQDALKSMDGSPLTVRFYVNLLGDNAGRALPASRNTIERGLWEPFIRFYPNIQFDYVYYYDLLPGDSTKYYKYPGKNIHEIAALEAEILGTNLSMFKTPDEVRGKLPIGDNIDVLVMEFAYKNRTVLVRTYRDDGVWPAEGNYSSAFKQLGTGRTGKIGFAVGHYERDVFDGNPRDYYIHTNERKVRSAISHFGVITDSLELAKGIPDSLDAVVLADPRSAYSDVEKDNFLKYIRKGGNAILHMEPDKINMLQFALNELGITPEEGIVVRLNKHEKADMYAVPMTVSGNNIANERAMERFRLYRLDGGAIWGKGAVHLNYKAINGFEIEPVLGLKGTDDTWIEKGVFKADSAAPVYEAAEGDIKLHEYIVGLKLTRKINNKEQRILVYGDSDFMSFYNYSMGSVGHASYSYVTDNMYPVYGNPAISEDRFINMSHKSSKIFQVVYVYVIGGLIVLTGIVLLIRRKRK